jgi:hypothetical protein
LIIFVGQVGVTPDVLAILFVPATFFSPLLGALAMWLPLPSIHLEAADLRDSSPADNPRSPA